MSSLPPPDYSPWAEIMDEINVASRDMFGHPTQYQRPGFPAFPIVGIPRFLDRLEDVNRGQFYSIFYRSADFNAAPFTASVTAIFTGVPNANGTLIFDGIAYTAVFGLDNTVPYQFIRGSSALGAAANLAACINGDSALAGTYISSATPPHPTCSAEWQDRGDGYGYVVVSARQAGTAGDTILAVDQMTAVTLDSKKFYGGGPMQNDLLTMNGILYRVSDVPEPDPEGGIQLRLEEKAL